MKQCFIFPVIDAGALRKANTEYCSLVHVLAVQVVCSHHLFGETGHNGITLFSVPLKWIVISFSLFCLFVFCDGGLLIVYMSAKNCSKLTWSRISVKLGYRLSCSLGALVGATEPTLSTTSFYSKQQSVNINAQAIKCLSALFPEKVV